MLQPGTVLNRKYRIEAAIGQGRLGYVYRARDQLTSERVAIKELVPVLGRQPQPVNRFIEELRGTLRLSHSDIARVYDIFQDGDTYYLAMEYLPGGSLADMLRFGPLPVDESLRIVDTLCGALAYAHGLGVIHCDIKPSNVLFDAGGGVHLADFSIAWISEELLPQRPTAGAGGAAGTAPYLAPEQLEGACNDPRVDIYALGALLYEMLCGQPYSDLERETTPEIWTQSIDQIDTEAPPSLRALNPDVPQWLADIVARTLQKAPEQRYSSAADLRQALSSQDPGRPPAIVAPQPAPPLDETGVPPLVVPPPPEPSPELAGEPEPGPHEETVLHPAAAVPAAALQLVMPDGGVVPLSSRSVIIGRGAGSDVMLSDTQVSRRHAIIEIDAQSVQVIDLDSVHGTFVNGERLARQVPHPLRAGDILRLGEATVLQVQAAPEAPERQAAVAPPPQAEGGPPAPESESTAAPPGRETGATEAVPERKGRPRWIWAALAGIAAIVLCLAGASALLMLVPVGDQDTPSPAASVLPASPTAGPGVSNTETVLPDSPTSAPAATDTAISPQTPAVTASATATSEPSATPTDTPTLTSTPVPSPTPTDTPTATATSTPTPSPAPTETSTPTATATQTATPSPTATEAPAPTDTVAVPPAVSDLVVESIDFIPFPPQQGLGNQVIITIRNDGPGNAGAFNWAWQTGASGPRTGRLAGLQAGETMAVVLTWIPTSLHAALPTVAEVDTASEVAESNETNNRLQVDVEVVQRP